MKQKDIKRILPGIFQQTVKDGSPISSFLNVMEYLHADPEKILDNLDSIFDPLRTKDEFVSFLAYWVDLDWIIKTGNSEQSIKISNLRQLISHAWYLSKWRGTAKGLLMFLEIATGIKGFEINEQVKNSSQEIIPFHIRIMIPKEAEIMLHTIEKIIEREKPAYVTASIDRLL